MPLGAQDVHSGRILHITLIALSAVVLGAIVWAGFAQVSDVASATGTLEPTAHERRIEHIDGGQVARLLVREGDRVTPDSRCWSWTARRQPAMSPMPASAGHGRTTAEHRQIASGAWRYAARPRPIARR
jgi:hypothetical protein